MKSSRNKREKEEEMSSTNMDETNQGKGGYGNHGLTFGQTKTKYEKLLSNEISSTVHNQCITKL